MPCDEGMSDNSVAILILTGLDRDRDRLDVEIAEKRIELLELGGPAAEQPSEKLSSSVGGVTRADASPPSGGEIAAHVRSYVIANHFEPARASGLKEITLRAGDLHKKLNYKNRMPAICSVLGSRRLEIEARVRKTNTSAPHNSSTTSFTYTIL